MSYKHYFYKIEKSRLDEIKDKTLDELLSQFGEDDEENRYISLPFGLLKGNQIFEFGKLYFNDTAQQIYSTSDNHMFSNEETKKYFKEYLPYVVGKEGLLKAIEIYTNKVKSFYQDLLIDTPAEFYDSVEIKKGVKATDKQVHHIEQLLLLWEYGHVLNLEEHRPQLTDSYMLEHTLFELVRLLKTINFENETIIFIGG